MFRETLQQGIISVLYSQGSKPLQVWNQKVSDGKIETVKDEETKTQVIEISGQNSSTTFIEGPNVHKDGFGLKLSWLHVLVKNLKKDFSFVVEVVDHKKQRRRFKFSNWFKDTRVKSTVVNIKLKMQEGWNHFVFDIKQICLKSYGTTLQEISKMVINASCRLKRVYFADKPYHLHPVSQIPNDFKVFIQGENNGKYQEQEEEEVIEEEEQDNN